MISYYILMVQYKTEVSPWLMHWRYCSLALYPLIQHWCGYGAPFVNMLENWLCYNFPTLYIIENYPCYRGPHCVVVMKISAMSPRKYQAGLPTLLTSMTFSVWFYAFCNATVVYPLIRVNIKYIYIEWCNVMSTTTIGLGNSLLLVLYQDFI